MSAALVTGGSRGVGACTARLLARAGMDIAIAYRNKYGRAAEVIADVEAAGRRGIAVQADLTSYDDLDALTASIGGTFAQIGLLVLNASGGMEKDRPADYAMRLNRDAQIEMLDHALPLMPNGSRIMFITSHQAHFYPGKPVCPAYESVAASKRAGEDALRSRIPEFAERGIDMIVVSGDLIEGTITAKLLDRNTPGLIESRRSQAGSLPTVEEFAQAIVTAAQDRTLETGSTVYVGSVDY